MDFPLKKEKNGFIWEIKFPLRKNIFSLKGK